MSEPLWVTFQKFSDRKLASELTSLLDENKIAYQFIDNSGTLDTSFGGSELLKEYAVLLRKADFETANDVLIAASVNDIDTIDQDYYLFGFSNDELRDVIVRSDEWNKFDYLLAQKLLKDRGLEISSEELASLTKQRLDELAKPEKPQTEGVVAGYVFSLLGGVFGIIIGWYLNTHKKTLPNGERLYAYLESDRRHGKRIFILGIFMLLVGLALKFFSGVLKNF